MYTQGADPFWDFSRVNLGLICFTRQHSHNSMSLYADIDSSKYRLLELNPELLDYIISRDDPKYVSIEARRFSHLANNISGLS